MTLLTEAKQIISEFISETRESLHWAANEVKKQYYLSMLKQIGEIYPDVTEYTDTVVAIIDEEFDAEDYIKLETSPDLQKAIDAFVASSIPDIDLTRYVGTIILTEKDCPDFYEPPEFETEAETDAFKFVEMKQNLSEDTEPSA